MDAPNSGIFVAFTWLSLGVPWDIDVFEFIDELEHGDKNAEQESVE